MTLDELYSDDIVTWAEGQVAALRRVAATSGANDVDWENVLEEIEALGRSEWRGVESQLVQALSHVLKLVCDHSSFARVAWSSEVRVALHHARDDFRNSMRSHVDVERVWAMAHRNALEALRDYRVTIPPAIPDTSPFTLDELMDPNFTCDTALRRLHGIIERPRQQEQRS